ncbi:hypothetical protein TNCT_568791 [Trichonephila clavata]|uniref:Uncharacterized protein n=1 Tax=Trichonephila clavata TaxID=2740835 RepID=A0A8X6FJK1_TRICU|nr:hypothetical protein TNCT_568791 [Trichonephila clavata]
MCAFEKHICHSWIKQEETFIRIQIQMCFPLSKSLSKHEGSNMIFLSETCERVFGRGWTNLDLSPTFTHPYRSNETVRINLFNFYHHVPERIPRSQGNPSWGGVFPFACNIRLSVLGTAMNLQR